MLKLLVLNYLIDTNNSASSYDVVLSVNGVKREVPPAALYSIRAALAQAEFRFHRTCSACDLDRSGAVSYGIERIMAAVADSENAASLEGEVATSSGGAGGAVTAATEYGGRAPGAAVCGTEPAGASTAVLREMRSTSQQTLISCRCTPKSVYEGDDEGPGAGATTTSSILGSVCALLLSKRGPDAAPGPRAESDAGSDKGGGSAGGRRSEPICRICFGGESEERLVRPCSCRGTIAAVHRSCLERWLQQAASSYCELCRHHFAVTRTHKWSWARSALEWAVSGRGRALLADALRGAALAAASVLGTARALHLCDRALYAAARRGGGAALAANVFSSLLIGVIGALNGLLTTWILLKIQEHRASWRTWRDGALHVHVALDEDPPAPTTPRPVRLERGTDADVADPFVAAAPDS